MRLPRMRCVVWREEDGEKTVAGGARCVHVCVMVGKYSNGGGEWENMTHEALGIQNRVCRGSW